MNSSPKKVDYFSLCSVRLDVRSRAQELADATGFFYSRKGKWFLVSNWHVFSGRNNYSGQCLDDHGREPTTIRTEVIRDVSPSVTSQGMEFNLLDDEGANKWIQHPAGQLIDIAALEMVDSELLEKLDMRFRSAAEHEDLELAIEVGSEVSVVGFPLKARVQGAFPIWKRASIASEPDFPVEGLPMILIDTASKEGMSGSPVYRRSSGAARYNDGSVSMGRKPHTKFLGIYSGRFRDEEFELQKQVVEQGESEQALTGKTKIDLPVEREKLDRLSGDTMFKAQIGRVFKRELLDELLDIGVRGSFQVP